MKVGIMEIMPQGHYTLVDSIARIYSSDKNNQVIIFTHNKASHVFNSLLKEKPENIRLMIKEENDSFESFFAQINDQKPDLVFIVTLERYFDHIYNFRFNYPIHLFIHNIDAWFQTSLKFSVYNFLRTFTLSAKLIYYFKVAFIYPVWRKKIINKLLNNNGRFVVLNKILKEELKKFVNKDLIEVIPFSVYNNKLKDNSVNNISLRVCIPGMVSQVRRDYFSVLNLLQKNIDIYIGKIELDLLGGIVPEEEGDEIIKQAERLTRNGLKVYFYKKSLVPIDEFDEQLTKADVILGNMNVIVNKYSKYGQTKETGTTFTMVRTAKPGILPANYALIDELHSSTLVFNDYPHLDNILKDLIINKDKLSLLKSEALKNSQFFEPIYLYNNITKQL
jgi:hypothetical protein